MVRQDGSIPDPGGSVISAEDHRAIGKGYYCLMLVNIVLVLGTMVLIVFSTISRNLGVFVGTLVMYLLIAALLYPIRRAFDVFRGMEDELIDEAENYRRLGNELCLRHLREEGNNGGGSGKAST